MGGAAKVVGLLREPAGARRRAIGYAIAVGGPALAVVLFLPLRGELEAITMSFVFLVIVVAAASIGRLGPGVAASVIALSKDNLKLRLAYSTVSQLSYIILGVALLTPTGIEGGVVHIANHAFSKITLFFCAGAIYVAAHKKNISEMSGLGRAMPFTFGAFAIASLVPVDE